MPVQVRDKGKYELFQTTQGHRILVLNGNRWFAWVKGQRGEILVHSDSDHQKQDTLQKGEFYVLDFKNDPEFKDMPHLFLQKGQRFEEAMIPDGLPSDSDPQKKVVKTGDTLSKKELENYVKHPEPAGPGEERMRRPGGRSVANIAHYLKGIDYPADKNGILDHARQNHAPKPVMKQLEGLAERKYKSMADLMKGVGQEDQGQSRSQGRSQAKTQSRSQAKPQAGSQSRSQAKSQSQSRSGQALISCYNELSVHDVESLLGGMDKRQIRRLRDYESKHKNRKTLLRELNSRLSA